jgi:hypothetical protein
MEEPTGTLSPFWQRRVLKTRRQANAITLNEGLKPLLGGSMGASVEPGRPARIARAERLLHGLFQVPEVRPTFLIRVREEHPCKAIRLKLSLNSEVSKHETDQLDADDVLRMVSPLVCDDDNSRIVARPTNF